MTTWSGRSGARRVGRRGVAELQDANVHTLSDRVVGQDGKILFLRGVPAGARSRSTRGRLTPSAAARRARFQSSAQAFVNGRWKGRHSGQDGDHNM